MKLNEWVAAASSRTGGAGPQPESRRRVVDALRGVRAETEDPVIYATEIWPEEDAEKPMLAVEVWAALRTGLAVVGMNAYLNPSRHFLQGAQVGIDVRPWRVVADDIRLTGNSATEGQRGTYKLILGEGVSMEAEDRAVDDLLTMFHECIRLAAGME
jgi:hypothetical protein